MTSQTYTIYDPNSDPAYLKALEALKQHSQTKPQYSNSYADELDSLYSQIVNRPSFTYDMNSDALYQQYKDEYITGGLRAMRDSAAKASHLTGGYASTYSQALSQQQYGGYMRELSAMIPQLYDSALGTYQQQGQDMLSRFETLGSMAEDEYSRYQDELTGYNQTLDYLSKQAQQAYEKGFESRNDAYKKLTELMAFSGYVPMDEDLKAAGMTREQADAYLKAWQAANPLLAYQTGAISAEKYKELTGTYPPGYGAGGGGYYGSKKKEDKDNSSEIAQQRAQIEADYHAGRIDYDDRERLVNKLYGWK